MYLSHYSRNQYVIVLMHGIMVNTVFIWYRKCDYLSFFKSSAFSDQSYRGFYWFNVLENMSKEHAIDVIIKEIHSNDFLRDYEFPIEN